MCYPSFTLLNLQQQQKCPPGLKHAGQRCVDASGPSAGALLTCGQQFYWEQQHHKSSSLWYEQPPLNMISPNQTWSNLFQDPLVWSANSSNSSRSGAEQDEVKANIDLYMEILAAISGLFSITFQPMSLKIRKSASLHYIDFSISSFALLQKN